MRKVIAATLLVLLLPVGAFASEKVKKGQPAPMDGRLFSTDETKQLMLDLDELQFLREKTGLQDQQITEQAKLILQLQELVKKQDQDINLWSNKYDLLTKELSIEKSKSRRKMLYFMAAALVFGYASGK